MDQLDLMARYIRYILPSSDPIDIDNGTLEQRINKMQVHMRRLVAQFNLSDEERYSFHLVLEFDKKIVTVSSQLWCLAKCVDKLASYTNLSKEVKESFFAEQSLAN